MKVKILFVLLSVSLARTIPQSEDTIEEENTYGSNTTNETVFNSAMIVCSNTWIFLSTHLTDMWQYIQVTNTRSMIEPHLLKKVRSLSAMITFHFLLFCEYKISFEDYVK